ncbi:MAG: hydrogenase maturation protease [candidate division KSB1 bacterium]|nr:hydrogenase maturation protease [candidate division KSB1 bacterium]
MRAKSILILGVGNLLLGDEGVGIHVVRQLRRLPLPPEVEVIDGGTGGFELLAHCRGRKKVAIIDAVKVAAEPGAVFRFAPEEVSEQPRPVLSAHEGGVHDLLHFCKTLVPPPEVIIYGIVPEETQRLSMQLSEMLARKLDEIVAFLIAEMKRVVASEKHTKE